MCCQTKKHSSKYFLGIYQTIFCCSLSLILWRYCASAYSNSLNWPFFFFNFLFCYLVKNLLLCKYHGAYLWLVWSLEYFDLMCMGSFNAWIKQTVLLAIFIIYIKYKYNIVLQMFDYCLIMIIFSGKEQHSKYFMFP